MSRSSGAAPGGGARRRWLAAVALAGAAALLASTAPPAVAAEPGPGPGSASRDVWSSRPGKPADLSPSGRKAEVRPTRFRAFALDHGRMRAALAKAPKERSAAARTPLVVELPEPGAGFERFAVVKTSVMAPGLAAAHPEITTYSGRSLDDPRLTLRMDITPLGLHASVRNGSGKGAWYVDPYYSRDSSLYVSYLGQDLPDTHGTFVEREDGTGSLTAAHDALAQAGSDVPVGPAVTLRTYRLALLTDPSYAAYFGTENVTAAKVTLVNRVNQVYEDDLAVHLELIDQTDSLNLDTAAKATGANGPCGSAGCFTPAQIGGCSGATLTRNRIVLGQLVGASAFDVGHIGLGLNGGGVASLGVVGGNAKAQGCTGLPQPVGDVYAVDYVAHEIGHQFGGPHTFNGTQVNCSTGNRSAGSSVEPGSGSSVMAYAGICQQDNLQPHSDPYFSQRSSTDIRAVIESSRPAIAEVQTVSLRDFTTDGQAFRLSWSGRGSDPITRGATYDAASLTAQITALTGSPVQVISWDGTSLTVNDAGFRVTFTAGGPLTAQDVASLGVVPVTDGVGGFVGETARGGAIANGGRTAVDSGNHAPVVTAAGNHTIPLRTPFALTGTATDSDGDAPSYMWEQNDRGALGTTAGTALVSNVKRNGPLFRQFGVAADVTPAGTLQSPSPGLNLVDGNPTRVFPDMAQVLADNTNAATGTCPTAPAPPVSGGASNVPAPVVECYSEFLPTVAYVGTVDVNAAPARLNMRLTVRDQHPGAGGVGTADTVLTLAPTAGPFRVTSLATAGSTLPGGRAHTVTWAVNGTDAPALAPNVKISLSTDGGWTWPTVLAATTANDGSASVQLPNPRTAQKRSRIKVEAVGNVFFDVNHADFTLAPALDARNDAPADGASVQYSDALDPTVTVSAESGDSDGSSLTATATGLPAGLSLQAGTASAGGDRPGTRTFTVRGNTTASPGSYPVTVTVEDGQGRSETTDFTVAVTREDARVTYTGQQSLATASPTSSTATLTLSGTVQDISVTGAAAGDTAAGDVRRASVQFVDRGTGAVLCSPAVGLVDAGDLRTGTATCTYPVSLGAADSRTLTVGMRVNGSYVRDSAADDSMVTVFKPLAGGFIAGGGYLTLTTPAGTKAGDVGSKSNVGFSVKYNRVGTNLQGSASVLTQRTEADGVVHTYQVKGTALTSLTVTGTDRATFTGKATIHDVTNPAAPVAVEGNGVLQLAMTDNGEPGSADTLAVTVLNRSGGTWFASTWNGTRTVEKALGGGNLRVR